MHGRIPVYAAFNLTNIFEKFDKSKLHLTGKQLMQIIANGDRHKIEVLTRVMNESVRLIIEDIIENNVTFHLPLVGANKALIRTHRITGGRLKMFLKYDKYADIDLLQSRFKAYELIMCIYKNGQVKRVYVYIVRRLLKKLIEKVNTGFVYGDSINDTTINDYIDKIQEKYPLINKKEIKMIVQYGWRQVYYLVNFGCDIRIFPYVYIGKLPSEEDPYENQQYFKNKFIRKARISFFRRKMQHNGYFYFCLTDERYQRIKDQKGMINYGRIFLYKLQDEVKILMYPGEHLFKVKYEDRLFCVQKDELITDQATEIMVATKDNIRPLKKNYEFI